MIWFMSLDWPPHTHFWVPSYFSNCSFPVFFTVSPLLSQPLNFRVSISHSSTVSLSALILQLPSSNFKNMPSCVFLVPGILLNSKLLYPLAYWISPFGCLLLNMFKTEFLITILNLFLTLPPLSASLPYIQFQRHGLILSLKFYI